MDIDEKISLSEYDVNWVTQFNDEKILLQNAFLMFTLNISEALLSVEWLRHQL